ncbi:MAG: FtsX-like permease family protein, partial [Eubacterium sp.]|nr:FtsX-like permease family protein [Eubacterium sp.]
MKHYIYPRLAVNGIRKNKRLYIPYILTCVGMVMMFYIISFLSSSSTIGKLNGGSVLQSCLVFGCGVIGLFSLIFLFYTNSFLIRRRKKEFGLYNILGMGKWNLAGVLMWESLIIMAVSILGGLFCGILFSKLAELLMVNIMHTEIDFSLTVEPKA